MEIIHEFESESEEMQPSGRAKTDVDRYNIRTDTVRARTYKKPRLNDIHQSLFELQIENVKLKKINVFLTDMATRTREFLIKCIHEKETCGKKSNQI